MTTIVAPELELIEPAGNAATHELQGSNHKPDQEAMRRKFVGGCVGYVYPTLRNAYAVGGSAGWVHP
jgi:hypothetical protein